MQSKFTLKKKMFLLTRIFAMALIFLSLSKISTAQVLYSEGFTDITALPGWANQNLSSPVGSTGWFQGNSGVFPSQAGAATAYIGANFNNTTGANTISNWLFMPNISIKNGDQFTFYTRVPTGGAAFPDRLQVRMSLNGASTNAGATATSVGDFTNLLLDINPTYGAAYPETWQQFTVIISGVPAPTSGRLAFRYFVENGGPSGANSNYIGIDEVVYTAIGACSGTPAPGATNSTANPVCPGINFTLSLATPGSGVTYQWQSSPDGTTWANITGANNATLTTSQTVATYYRCNVTCGANTGISTALQVNMAAPSACYCTPAATTCTLDDEILNVRLGTLNNPSSGCSGAGYTYYSAVAAPDVFIGAPNPMSVSVGPGGTEHVAVWIDYNKNGQFETTEFTALGSGNGSTVNGAVAVPASALTGTTRMRVRVRWSTALKGTQACIGGFFGETEDYNVNLIPCVPATITSAPTSVSIVCGANASFTVAAAGSLPTYSWQFRTSSSGIWQTVTNSGIYSGATTATLSLTNIPQTYSGYQYRALVTGACSAVDFTSPPATLTVNAIVPTVTPASATICAGSVQQLTLTNTLGNTDLINEGFNSITPLPAGWFTQNNSSPVGTTGWFQGSSATFPSQSGVPTAYIAANFNNTTGNNTISNWLLTPAVSIKNGDVLKFYTRTVSAPAFADRLEVRMSTSGASTNVGATNTSVGDFTNLLLTVNPTLITTGAGSYPNTWTQFTATVSGVTGTVTGRFAFRYFVTSGGPGGANSDYIGIDEVVYTSTGGSAQGVWSGPAGTIFTDNLGTVPYVSGTPITTVYVKPTATTNNYTVNFTTLTPCTSATTTVPVNVSNPATGLAVTPSTRAVCLGGSTTFVASTIGGNPIAYQWQVSTDGGLTYNNITGATSSTLTVSSVTQSMSGNRYRFVVTSAPCTPAVTSTAFGTLTVNPLPTVTLSSPVVNLVPGRTTTITGTSTPAAAAGGWSWTLNGSALSGTTNTQVVNIDGVGSYQATVTDVNGCVASSNTLVIGSEASDKLWIYPNPTTGAFQVRLYYEGGLAEKRVVSIYNPLGQLITSREFTLVSGTAPYMRMDFDLGGVKAKGTYVVKVANMFTGKVVSGLVLVQ
ncbi:MAG: choice-of-anchor J domain-containing protein [Chitinophagaceae bacterium]|nr:choice-of-anchor J domain-containing protein [Chitinophagaceae bacterium]